MSIVEKLQAPFADAVVKWKVQTANEKWATCVAYVDSRIVASHLDSATNGLWQDEYREVNGLLMCRIGIYMPEIQQWVWREDTGAESNIDKEKGHVSDAFKRAAVKWGVGRGLYELPIINLQTVKNFKQKDTPSYQGKQLYGDGVTGLCRKLIELKGTKDAIWFKSNTEAIGASKPPPPPSNAGKGVDKKILPLLTKGTDKQKQTVARMLSSTKCDNIRELAIGHYNAANDDMITALGLFMKIDVGQDEKPFDICLLASQLDQIAEKVNIDNAIKSINAGGDLDKAISYFVDKVNKK